MMPASGHTCKFRTSLFPLLLLWITFVCLHGSGSFGQGRIAIVGGIQDGGNPDAAALREFKKGLNASVGVVTSWNRTVCLGSTSSWQGVECAEGRVVGLKLGASDITGGTLSPALAGLVGLKRIEISGCNLTGTLPDAWATMSNLEWLDISNNRLRGTLPESWSGLESLQHVDLAGNQLSGSLPGSWGDLSRVDYVYLDNNRFNGTLPPEWAGLGSDLAEDFVDITISYNSLTGELPTGWSAWDNLGKLYLAYNSLTGTLPASWQSLQKLSVLSLFGNSLSGTLPPEWDNITNINSIDISNNSLSGTLPRRWSKLSRIKLVYLYKNYLRGTLPVSWGNMASVEEIMIMFNNFTGTLPEEWGRLTTLKRLSVASNNLTGPLPNVSWANGMSALEGLYLQKNHFTGSLPPIWFTSSAAWKQLVFLDIRWNNLQGILPESSQGSSFRPDRQRTPRIYAEPMNQGFGMCGAVPDDGPRVLSFLEDNMKPNASDGTQLLSFSARCGPGGPPSIAKLVGIATAGGLAVLGILTAMLILSRIQRKGRGNKLTHDFFKGSMRSMTSWQRQQVLSHGDLSPSMATSTIGLLQDPTPSPFSLPGTHAPDFSNVMRLAARPSGITIPSTRSSELSKRTHSSLSSNRSMCEEDIEFSVDDHGRRVVLGAGAYGKVYKATWRKTRVAVKVLKEEHHLDLSLAIGEDSDKQQRREKEREKFENEAELLATLRHPNIVNFLGFSLSDTSAMVVTELCSGGNLARAMRRARRTRAFGWYMRGAKIALDVARGLAYLHQMGVIHYDIKPGNILLDSSGDTAKISDVGLSKSLASITGTASNTVRGTLEYMAPEMFYGERTSYAVDIYSFGVMLCEIITGETPDRRAGTREPRVPEECTDAALKLYYRCVDPKAEMRPTSVELVDELRRIQPDEFTNPDEIL